jgi:hypothetical protein
MPKARKSLAFEHWPEIDQRLWQQAVRDDDLLTGTGHAALWASRTRETVCKGYADWLFWLKSIKACSTPPSRRRRAARPPGRQPGDSA